MAVPAPLPRYKNLSYPFSEAVWLSLLGSIVATTLAVSLGELHRSGVRYGQRKSEVPCWGWGAAIWFDLELA